MPSSSAKAKNSTKYWSYIEAFDRMESAQKLGFFLEVVTIAESIISDRLLSFLWKRGSLDASKHDVTTSFGKLIEKWKAYDAADTTLAEKVDTWRKKRNTVVHSIVKSIPGTEHSDIDDFLAQAEKTATEGKELAEEVRTWYNNNATVK